MGPAAELKGLGCWSCFHLSFLALLQGTPSSILPSPCPQLLSLCHHQLSNGRGLESGARSVPAVSRWLLRAHPTTLPRGERTSEQAPTQRGSTVGRSQVAQQAAEHPPRAFMRHRGPGESTSGRLLRLPPMLKQWAVMLLLDLTAQGPWSSSESSPQSLGGQPGDLRVFQGAWEPHEQPQHSFPGVTGLHTPPTHWLCPAEIPAHQPVPGTGDH